MGLTIMIKDGIDFHNVVEMTETEKGWRMWRIPSGVAGRMDEGASETACRSTGVELRFKMKGDAVVIKLCVEENMQAQTAAVFYGAFQGGWRNSTRAIHTHETAITIERPQNLDFLLRITEERGLGFNPEVVRILLPGGSCRYLGIEGEVEAPGSEDYPEKTYLAYGSSITHGSLGLSAACTYPFQIAQQFGCDCINLGFPGNAHAEKPLAEYIAGRMDWDFASVEIGINMLSAFSEKDFEKRAREFLSVLKEDGRLVFVSNIFGYYREDRRKADKFREIVKACAEDGMIFTDGPELLDDPALVSQVLAHPSMRGIYRIGERWYEIMEKHMKNSLIASRKKEGGTK